MRKLELLACCLGVVSALGLGSAWAETLPATPRIDSLVSLRPSPLETDAAVIWYDDFDGPQKQYTESQGRIDTSQGFGGSGGSMLNFYKKGTRGVGNRKVFFGDSPTGKVVNRGRQYDEIYWRVYVKHQHGWTGGGPAKLSRATSIVSPTWAQGMIAHVWSSGEALTLDPATGVRGDSVVTTKYNDFGNLKWLGNRPASSFKLHSTEESGRWVCVEARVKLNTPGKKDGLNQLWIDGRLEAERTNLDWRGNYAKHGINAVFLETYWNRGSPVTQSRWIDNFVISTKLIGPVICPRNPVLIKTPYRGLGKQCAWEVEIAADDVGKATVWKSNLLTIPERVEVGEDTGCFVGPLSGRKQLDSSKIYHIRVRQQSETGKWSAWSLWHQPFKTAESP
ncbi:MAG: hypothetical protein CEE38_20250 [Planctomycetes bacterium B3_Pla]|nr:MAG: hypothetical protein CEE38_20250 [Planctomycetes bacterium B3_Pla]